MRYCEALQMKRQQIYKLSKFPKFGDGPRASLEHSNFTWKWLSNPNNFLLQRLTAHNFAIICYQKIYSTSFERSTNFLQHKIFKKWFSALLRWFMQSQRSLILLHKMAFQPFWLDLTVFVRYFTIRKEPKNEKKQENSLKANYRLISSILKFSLLLQGLNKTEHIVQF